MLTAYEKETCINFSEESDLITITTYNKKYIREILSAVNEYPASITIVKNKDGSVIFTCEVGKRWNRFHVPKKRKPVSEELTLKRLTSLEKARIAKAESKSIDKTT